MTTPVPGYLAPTWRYLRNDWAGTTALKCFVYSVAAVYQTNADGSIAYGNDGNPIVIIPGVLMDLTGCSVLGTITVQRECCVLPAPIGAIFGDPKAGTITLSLLKPYTGSSGLRRQSFSDWTSIDLAQLMVEYRVIDASGYEFTVGLQPLFVF